MQALISEALDKTVLSEIFEKSQAEQDKLIQKLQANVIQESTEKSTSLHIEDASNVPAILEIEGNQVQNAKQSYNLIDISSIGSGNLQGVDYSVEDDVVNLNGNYAFGAVTTIKNIINNIPKKNSTYKLKIEIISGSQEYYAIGLSFRGTNDSQINFIQLSGYSQQTEISKQMDLTELKNVGFYFAANTNAVFNNFKFKIMFYEVINGEDNKEYEKFEVSPSWRFPSNIKTVKNIKIINSNKNFAKTDGEKTITRAGVTVSLDAKGIFCLNGTATNGIFLNLIDLTSTNVSNLIGYNIASKKYKLLLEILEINNSQIAENADVHFYAKVAGTDSTQYVKVTNLIASQNKRIIQNFEVTKDTITTYIYIASNVVLDNFKFRFAIFDENEIYTTFVNHKEKSYELEAQQEMLSGDKFDLIKNTEIHNWNKVTLTGTENININSDIDDYIEFIINDILPYNSKSGYNLTYCTHFGSSTNNRCMSHNKSLLIRIPKPNTLTTIELFKSWLQENNIDIYYQLEETIELELTKKQKETLEQLNNLTLFKGINNIITTDNLAIMKLIYYIGSVLDFLSCLSYCAIGDSLTYGFETSSTRLDKPYPLQVGEILNLVETFNNGVSGSTIANVNSSSISNDARLNSYENADIISIMGGTNDYYNEKSLGELTDEDDTTFYGGYKKILKKLIEDNPTSLIFTIIPPCSRYLADRQNTQNYSWLDMSNAIKKISEYFGIPCLDANSLGRLGFVNKTQWTLDGTHFTQEYVDKIFAPLVSKFIENNLKGV